MVQLIAICVIAVLIMNLPYVPSQWLSIVPPTFPVTPMQGLLSVDRWSFSPVPYFREMFRLEVTSCVPSWWGSCVCAGSPGKPGCSLGSHHKTRPSRCIMHSTGCNRENNNARIEHCLRSHWLLWIPGRQIQIKKLLKIFTLDDRSIRSNLIES